MKCLAKSVLPIACTFGIAWLAQNPACAQQAVSDASLDGVRGGFDVGHGLLASFGISRAVYIDGNLVAHTSVFVPDAADMTAAQAGALASVGAAQVIQNGPGNLIDPAVLARMGGTVIQNTLDNQQIKSITTIDATVNDLALFRSLNLQDSLQAAVVGSRGQ